MCFVRSDSSPRRLSLTRHDTRGLASALVTVSVTVRGSIDTWRRYWKAQRRRPETLKPVALTRNAQSMMTVHAQKDLIRSRFHLRRHMPFLPPFASSLLIRPPDLACRFSLSTASAHSRQRSLTHVLLVIVRIPRLLREKPERTCPLGVWMSLRGDCSCHLNVPCFPHELVLVQTQQSLKKLSEREHKDSSPSVMCDGDRDGDLRHPRFVFRRRAALVSSFSKRGNQRVVPSISGDLDPGCVDRVIIDGIDVSKPLTSWPKALLAASP